MMPGGTSHCVLSKGAGRPGESLMSTVLVIDDDRSTLDLMRHAFRDSGLTVETAKDAAEGLAIITARRADLVVLDVMLPDASGLSAVQSIKRLDPRLPGIFITAGGTTPTGPEAGQERR